MSLDLLWSKTESTEDALPGLGYLQALF